MTEAMRRIAITAVLFVLFSVSTAWPVVRLTDSQAKNKGAVCLDGTNPVFYYGNATSEASRNKWLLYFKGGGWCYTEDSCADRARTTLGSTKNAAADFSFGGVASDDTKENPEMASWNHVVLWYCDGASFSGDRTAPYHHNKTGQTLYFRGKRVLDSMLEVLLTDYGLNRAEEVLLSGGSAGGLSTYLHADYVGTKLPKSVKRYKAAPNSGFFALHKTATEDPLYPSEMENVYHMQNSSGGVNQACAAAFAGRSDAWRCIFANYSYAYSTTPMFPLQSALDSWQMGNIFLLRGRCEETHFGNCTEKEIQLLNGYLNDIVADYKRTEKFKRPGEGGFLESCLEHVAAQGSAFDVMTIRGVKEVDAFIKWWRSDNEPSHDHWYWPCSLSESAPHQCNPTCNTRTQWNGCAPDDLMCQ